MRVLFLKDYGKCDDPELDEPLFEKGEYCSLFDDFAKRLIEEGVVEER